MPTRPEGAPTVEQGTRLKMVPVDAFDPELRDLVAADEVLQREVAAGDFGSREVARPDTGALDDPRVGGVDQRLEVHGDEGLVLNNKDIGGDLRRQFADDPRVRVINANAATGDASAIWPIRSRRTFARVTSTPQRSQMMPL